MLTQTLLLLLSILPTSSNLPILIIFPGNFSLKPSLLAMVSLSSWMALILFLLPPLPRLPTLPKSPLTQRILHGLDKIHLFLVPFLVLLTQPLYRCSPTPLQLNKHGIFEPTHLLVILAVMSSLLKLNSSPSPKVLNLFRTMSMESVCVPITLRFLMILPNP